MPFCQTPKFLMRRIVNCESAIRRDQWQVTLSFRDRLDVEFSAAHFSRCESDDRLRCGHGRSCEVLNTTPSTIRPSTTLQWIPNGINTTTSYRPRRMRQLTTDTRSLKVTKRGDGIHCQHEKQQTCSFWQTSDQRRRKMMKLDERTENASR